MGSLAAWMWTSSKRLQTYVAKSSAEPISLAISTAGLFSAAWARRLLLLCFRAAEASIKGCVGQALLVPACWGRLCPSLDRASWSRWVPVELSCFGVAEIG